MTHDFMRPSRRSARFITRTKALSAMNEACLTLRLDSQNSLRTLRAPYAPEIIYNSYGELAFRCGWKAEHSFPVMTIHKLNPDKANTESRSFTAGISFNYDLSDIGEAVFKTRAIQTFENTAAWYPIHRLVRCAARRKLEDVFDEIGRASCRERVW